MAMFKKVKCDLITLMLFLMRLSVKAHEKHRLFDTYCNFWNFRQSSKTFLFTMALHLRYHSGAANKYYSSVGHNEQKNKKPTGQIKFSAVTIKQRPNKI